MGAKRNAYRIMLGKPEGKRPLERRRHRWEDKGWYVPDGSGSGQGPVRGYCEHGNEPSGSIKCWEVLE
jgi:hypothetical protein